MRDGAGVEASEVADDDAEVDAGLGVADDGALVLLALDDAGCADLPLDVEYVLSVGDEPAAAPVLPLHKGEYPPAYAVAGDVLHDHLADPCEEDDEVHGEVVVECCELVGEVGVVEAVLGEVLYLRRGDVADL